ncbi:sulfatase-like hydrolase/transferase [Pantoea sp. ME81]|uniref:sulfatase-like hydrolase/transferase n=1 Tax=Pantoea sp. ME81 TaxID=2743935 RepID=UPI0015F72480|nr:sulfatase-like hydrolase/transferase [Pantoea sp. ME81]
MNKPNVLLICTDHWYSSLLGVAGHPSVQTPGLDEIAEGGVRFTNAYSECPVCIPARRTLMSGLTPKSHGDRVFNDTLTFPDVPTLAQAFRNAGYQADAVGKLHVHPQRDRIGFDSVLLDDEGRPQWGVIDDYDIYLGDQGYAGRQFDHGMSNNQYHWRPWHLPEETHATAWAGRMMARTIKRRDPTKPGFWYLGFRAPHPPLVPPQSYLDLYNDIEIDQPARGSWVSDDASELPFAISAGVQRMGRYNEQQLKGARKAFYALCTQIDHQIRYLVGTLRMEGLLDNTIICFISDHGDMMGEHGMLAKRMFYENSANIPMIIRGVKGCTRVTEGKTDNRLVGLADVMPTLLDLCGIDAPAHCEGLSMFSDQRRDTLYGECSEGDHATRMIHDGRFKLIYYATGNAFQLFDLDNDPGEMTNLSNQAEYHDVQTRLQQALADELYGQDLEWIQEGKFVGWPDKPFVLGPHRNLNSQRGDGWPPSPPVDIPQVEWHKNVGE